MREKRLHLTQLTLYLFLFVFLILPLFRLLTSTSLEEIASLFSDQRILTAARNSIAVSATASILSVAVSFCLAFFMARSTMRWKPVFKVLLIMPMLVPSISHGSGLIILFGSRGIFTQLFGLTHTIYGFWGIVAGAFLYSYPVAFIMFHNILAYEDGSPYEAARVLGISSIHQFLSITVPYLKKPFFSTFLAVFTMIFTDYGIPLAIGGKYLTLPAILYQEVIGQLDFSMGSSIGLLLLCPALIAFCVDLFKKEQGTGSSVMARRSSLSSKKNNGFAYFFCFSVTLLNLMIFSAFLLLAFTTRYPDKLTPTLTHFSATFRVSGVRYLGNSIVISLAAAVFGTIIAFIAACCTARARSRYNFVLHLLLLLTLAIPGLVLGLSYSILFSSTILYGTLFLLILVNIIHFIHSPYLLMYNSLLKLDHNLESVGLTLGISRFHMIKDVLLPQTKDTLLDMGVYFFTNSMTTISAVIFLSTTLTKPLSLTISQFEALMSTECAAVVALIILLSNLVVRFLAEQFKKSRKDVHYVNL